MGIRVAITLEQCWHRVPGGTATSALALADALVRAGEVDLIGVAAHHRRPPASPFEPPVPVRSMRLPRRALYEAWHGVRWPPVERAAGPVDVIHASGGVIPPRTRPLVVTIHDLAFLRFPEHFTKRGRRFLNRAWALACAEADVVVCPSRAAAAECAAAGRSAVVVPWGVVQPCGVRDPDAARRVRAQYALPEPFVLAVGTIEPRKNLSGLLAALRELPDEVSLVVAGPSGWREDLRAGLVGLERRVRVLGFVPEADLAGLYAAASVFCYPSLHEGFGLPVLEAMANGTPVVTSAGTATEEVAGGSAILVDPNDPASIAQGLSDALGDTGRAARLVESGRRRAAEFSWRRTAQEMLAVYQQVVA